MTEDEVVDEVVLEVESQDSEVEDQVPSHSSHTSTQVSTLPRARSTCLSPET